MNTDIIKNKLDQILDSDLQKTLGELNSVKKINLSDNAVQVYIELVQPIHLIYSDIKQKVKDVLNETLPDFTHEIFISELSNNPKYFRQFLHGVKNIVAVASGKGGVGKSSIAANIAAALSKTGAKVGILDGDVYGPSQPTMFGLQGEKLSAVQLPDGSTTAVPAEKYGMKVASMGFIMDTKDAAIVRGPMLAGYFSMLFEQIEWGDLDYLIFDLPPGTGDIQLTLTQKIPLTGAVIVTTPQEISLADVRRSITMFEKVKVDVLGIVENMSYFTPPDMPDRKYYIFGKGGGESIANEFNVELLGEVPLDMHMRDANDGGMPVVLSSTPGLPGEAIVNVTKVLITNIRKKNYSTLEVPNIDISI